MRLHGVPQFQPWHARPYRAHARAVQSVPGPGVLAYVDGEVAGWCSVAPKSTYRALVNSRTIPHVQDEAAWSVVCFVVRPGSGGGGVPLKQSRIALRSRTLGGVMLWGDVLWFREWHIQRHAVVGHCRLLDGQDKRLTWGSYETCLAELERIKAAGNLKPMRGKVVVLLHGLGGFRTTMQPLGDYLRDQGKFQIVNVAYPSTLADISTHAQALAGIIDQLPEVEEFYFVAHSLGNLVVRNYLGDQVRSPASKTRGSSGW